MARQVLFVRIREIQILLNATLLCGADMLDDEVASGFGADLMSDVLAFTDSGTLLLTGLCNLQTIRPADMLDISHVVFVRGKCPDESMLQLARECGICVLATSYTMFKSCGLLYAAGLPGGERDDG